MASISDQDNNLLFTAIDKKNWNVAINLLNQGYNPLTEYKYYTCELNKEKYTEVSVDSITLAILNQCPEYFLNLILEKVPKPIDSKYFVIQALVDNPSNIKKIN